MPIETRALLPHPTDSALVLVPLANNRGVATIDAKHREAVGKYNWALVFSKDNNVDYAQAHVYGGGRVRLHRLIARLEGLDLLFHVDHKNHDGLDCRADNLRSANNKQNAAHSRKSCNNTSGFKGVSWNKQKELWCAYIRIDYKLKHLGVFASPKDAAKAYDCAAVAHFGPFALTNFPLVEAA